MYPVMELHPMYWLYHHLHHIPLHKMYQNHTQKLIQSDTYAHRMAVHKSSQKVNLEHIVAANIQALDLIL